MSRHGTPQDDASERPRPLAENGDHEIRAAAERGDLSGLPGEGRPLPRHEEEEALGDRWAAAHVLRGANAAPEWADLRREIDEGTSRLVRRIRLHREWLAARSASLRTLPAERILDQVRATEEVDRRFREELASVVSELNAKIARHNLLARAELLQLAPLTSARVAQLAREE